MLATSRETLRVDGRARPFALDGLADGACDAAAARPGGSARHDPAAIADVIGRLDGLPLAIELAAGKLRSITARRSRARAGRAALAARRWRSDDAARGSARWRRRSPGATSCSRLPSSASCGGCAAFVGGFDAATAERVAAGDGVERSAVLPALARLVDASLVVADSDRYRLLLTVRVFARERLAEAGEAAAVTARHGEAYLAFAGGALAQYDHRSAGGLASARPLVTREPPGRPGVGAPSARRRPGRAARGPPCRCSGSAPAS